MTTTEGKKKHLTFSVDLIKFLLQFYQILWNLTLDLLWFDYHKYSLHLLNCVSFRSKGLCMLSWLIIHSYCRLTENQVSFHQQH